MATVRAEVALLCLCLTGCWPPIDELVTDPAPAPARTCGLPDPALGVAVPSGFLPTAYPDLQGISHAVDPGADLQAVIDQAQPGDEIVLAAGGEYSGPITLPFKGDTGPPIVIRSGALFEIPEGQAVGDEHAAKLATVRSTDSAPAVVVGERARGWRLAGVRLTPPSGVSSPALLRIGSSSSTLPEALPTEIVIDRSWIAGDPVVGATRGIELSARAAAIIDSRITDIVQTAANSRGIQIDNAVGPILVHSSVIEAAWQNVSIGSFAPGSPELFPSDIAICRSVLRKRDEWYDQDFDTRSLIEIERGRRILVSGSLLERSLPAVQPGIGIAVRDDGLASGLPTSDLAFVDIRVRNVQQAIESNTSGTFGGVQRVVFENAEFSQVSDRLFRLLGGGIDGLSLVHVTAIADHSMLEGVGTPNANLLVRDSLFETGLYGIRGDGIGSGIEALDAYFAPWTVSHNVLVGADADDYPPDNVFPPTLFEAGVVDADAGNYRLAPGSAFEGSASDGSDPGADIDRLEAALPPP